MTDEPEHPNYNDLAGMPAHELLALSHEELNAFILVAEKTEAEAKDIRQWLASLKVEKSLREETGDAGAVKHMGISFRSSLAEMLGRSLLSDEELAELRRKAWHEQNLLIVDPWDYRLTAAETQSLQHIGKRLYTAGVPS